MKKGWLYLYRGAIPASILGLAGTTILTVTGIFTFTPALIIAALISLLLGIAGLLSLTERHSLVEQEVIALSLQIEQLTNLLDSSPSRSLLLSGQTHDLIFDHKLFGLPEAGQGQPKDVQSLVETLQPSDGTLLAAAVEQLNRTGRPFSLKVSERENGRTLLLDGCLTGSGPGRPVLWMRDISTHDSVQQDALVAAREQAASAEIRNRQLTRISDALPIPLWMRGEDNRILWCNRQYAGLVGASPEDVVVRQIELSGGAQTGTAHRLAERARQRAAPVSEWRSVVVEGERRFLEVTKIPSGDGTLLAYALDGTRIRELEGSFNRLKKSRNDVLEQLGSGIAIFGADTRLVFHNRAYARIWQLDEQWLETHPTFAEVMEDMRVRRQLPEQADYPAFKRRVMSRFTEAFDSFENQMHLPDGRTLRSLCVPHEPGGLLFVLEDVTQSLMLESSYKTVVAVQKETLDHLNEAVAVFGSDGRLKLFNPAYLALWQLDESDAAHEPHLTWLIEHIRPLLDDGGNWEVRSSAMLSNLLSRAQFNIPFRFADDRVFVFSQVPLPDGGVLVSFHDITDSSRIESALRASNEALESADRLKSEFIANVSYQLRTPLNTIMGFSEILSNQYFGPLNSRQSEYIQGILQSGQRLTSLVDDILDLATIQAGHLVLQRTPVHAGHLLKSVLNLALDRANRQGQSLTLLPVDETLIIDGDERRLRQALFNLISNALTFTGQGGQIQLSAARQDDWIVVSVADNGPGVAAGDRNRILLPFERAGPRIAEAGAGLGLSLVTSIVDLHGGRIELTDSPLKSGYAALPDGISPLDEAAAADRPAFGLQVCCYLPAVASSLSAN